MKQETFALRDTDGRGRDQRQSPLAVLQGTLIKPYGGDCFRTDNETFLPGSAGPGLEDGHPAPARCTDREQSD